MIRHTPARDGLTSHGVGRTLAPDDRLPCPDRRGVMPNEGTMGTDAPRGRRRLQALAPAAYVLVATVALMAFPAVGREFYDDYHLPQGSGMNHLLPEELAFYAMYFVFGTLAMAGLWLALRETRVPLALVAGVRRLAAMGWLAGAPGAVVVSALCALIGQQVLRHAVISDDEHVYQFIAQTLRHGAVTAPSPGADLAFFREQFVVLTPAARFGKYPIGYPLLLAAGQTLGAEPMVVPALMGALAAVVYVVGRIVGGAAVAIVALLLFATSPQILLTGATFLSQPPAALCLAAAVASLLAADRPDAGLGWIFGAGAFLGFGVLCRPLPGVLFVPVAAIYVVSARPGASRAAAVRLLALALPVVAAGAVILLVNRAQVGRFLVTAYAESLAPGGGPAALLVTTSATFAMRAMSLLGSLIRLNFWLFGWPASLALCVVAGWSRRTALLWGMSGASLVYRVLTPKVGVGGAGPIYFFEVTALLCVLAAVGALRLARRCSRTLASSASMAALMTAATIVSLAAFLPSRLADLGRMGAAQNLVETLIHERGISQALVFHEGVVPWWTRLSWAYYPRCNSPALDDDVLYILLQRANGLQENVEFWKRRYPSRSAWFFGYLDGRAALVPLDDYIRRSDPAHPDRALAGASPSRP